MLNGNMVLGTFRDGMMVRIAKADHSRVVDLPGASAMEMKGRVMEGFILIKAEAVAADEVLCDWIEMALAYNATLPAKTAKMVQKKKVTK